MQMSLLLVLVLPSLRLPASPECKCLLFPGSHLGLNCVTALLCFHCYKYDSCCYVWRVSSSAASGISIHTNRRPACYLVHRNPTIPASSVTFNTFDTASRNFAKWAQTQKRRLHAVMWRLHSSAMKGLCDNSTNWASHFLMFVLLGKSCTTSNLAA